MRYLAGMIASGTFEVTPTPEPPLDTADGVIVGRMTFAKTFQGAVQATSTVHMTYARTPTDSSAGYVAVEKIDGEVDGRVGSFVVMHTGVMAGGDLNLVVAIVPDSGTGNLAGISGTMTIDDSDGGHSYALEYQLP